MTLVFRLTVLRMDEKTRTEFKERHYANLQPLLDQDGLHVSLGLVYALAKR